MEGRRRHSRGATIRVKARAGAMRPIKQQERSSDGKKTRFLSGPMAMRLRPRSGDFAQMRLGCTIQWATRLSGAKTGMAITRQVPRPTHKVLHKFQTRLCGAVLGATFPSAAGRLAALPSARPSLAATSVFAWWWKHRPPLFNHKPQTTNHEPQITVWPLHYGKESVADYAKRVNLPPTQMLDLGGGVKMDLVLIPAGKFLMGSPETEQERDTNETQHEVTITNPFYMAKCETTQEQYEAIIGGNPSSFKSPKNPVEQVSWDTAQTFCLKLSAKYGKAVRLPTEAEWEYACRAGTRTAYHTGDSVEDLARAGWYLNLNGAVSRSTHPVGQKAVNAWGLYDMHGNVWEWCQDWYGEYPAGSATDPQGAAQGALRVVRGGSRICVPPGCRSAYRNRSGPGSRNVDLGFRVVVGAPRTP